MPCSSAIIIAAKSPTLVAVSRRSSPRIRFSAARLRSMYLQRSCVRAVIFAMIRLYRIPLMRDPRPVSRHRPALAAVRWQVDDRPAA